MRLKKLSSYRVFGADGRAAGEDTEEVWDLLNRHDTLKSANTDLQGQVREGEKAVDGMRAIWMR